MLSLLVMATLLALPPSPALAPKLMEAVLVRSLEVSVVMLTLPPPPATLCASIPWD